MRFWTTVESQFEVTGRGLWIIPDHEKWPSDIRIRENDKIQLRTADGNVLDTCIASIGSGSKGDGTRFLTFGVRQLKLPQVPPGTEIWLADEQAT